MAKPTVAIVLGFRWPFTWAFVLLTKVTPGVGLLWFAVRREWRSLAIALGDGANDLAMIERAGLGIAYHAKPAVAAAADARIDRSDLTALLYMQGYRREDFSEDGD